MALSPNINNLEKDKFRPGPGDLSRVAVEVENDSPIPVLFAPDWDEIDASYPDSLTEVFTYKKDAATVLTITVVYTSQSKKYITSVVRV